MEFQEKLKQRRLLKKLTQQELADNVFVSRSTVAKWETGISLPGKEAVSHLSDLFNENVEEWFETNEKVIVAKNRKIARCRHLITALAVCIFCLTALFVILWQSRPKEEHIVYDGVPLLYLNGNVAKLYKIGSEYVNEDGILKPTWYPVTFPKNEELQSLIPLSISDEYHVYSSMAKSIDIFYTFLNQDREPFTKTSKGWNEIETHRLVLEHGESFYFSFPERADYALIEFSCNYQDLNVHYYYVVSK